MSFYCCVLALWSPQPIINTFSGGCLGSSSDEERSEARYAWRCAEIRDLKVFECTAPCASAQGTSGSASLYDLSVCLNTRSSMIAHHRSEWLWCVKFSVRHTTRTLVMMIICQNRRARHSVPFALSRGTAFIGLCHIPGPELRLGYPLNLSI